MSFRIVLINVLVAFGLLMKGWFKRSGIPKDIKICLI